MQQQQENIRAAQQRMSSSGITIHTFHQSANHRVRRRLFNDDDEKKFDFT